MFKAPDIVSKKHVLHRCHFGPFQLSAARALPNHVCSHAAHRTLPRTTGEGPTHTVRLLGTGPDPSVAQSIDLRGMDVMHNVVINGIMLGPHFEAIALMHQSRTSCTAVFRVKGGGKGAPPPPPAVEVLPPPAGDDDGGAPGKGHGKAKGKAKAKAMAAAGRGAAGGKGAAVGGKGRRGHVGGGKGRNGKGIRGKGRGARGRGA